MDIELQLEGTDDVENSLFDLHDWINRERIRGLSVRRDTVPPKPGEMGPELVELLSVVGPIAAPVLVELVKSAFGWFRMRRPAMKIIVRIGPNSIEIDTNNLGNEQEIIERVLAHSNELRG